MSKPLDSDNTLSLTKILALRGEAHASIRHHAAEIISLSSALCDVDACTASCRLASFLESEGQR